MPTTLGFDSDMVLNNPVDREYRQFMSSSLQQLGKQVQDGIKQIVTNRQLKQMTAELQNVDPASSEFPHEMMSVIERYPAAVSDPRGAFGLSMLGAEHKNWLTLQAKKAAASGHEWAPVPGGVPGQFYNKSDPTKSITNPNIHQKPILRTTPGQGTDVLFQDPNDPNSFTSQEVIPGREPAPKSRQTRTMPNGVVEEFYPETNVWSPIASPNNAPKQTAITPYLNTQKVIVSALQQQFKEANKTAYILDAQAKLDNGLRQQADAAARGANKLKKRLDDAMAELETLAKQPSGPAINRMGAGAIPGIDQPYDRGGGIGSGPGQDASGLPIGGGDQSGSNALSPEPVIQEIFTKSQFERLPSGSDFSWNGKRGKKP